MPMVTSLQEHTKGQKMNFVKFFVFHMLVLLGSHGRSSRYSQFVQRFPLVSILKNVKGLFIHVCLSVKN